MVWLLGLICPAVLGGEGRRLDTAAGFGAVRQSVRCWSVPGCGGLVAEHGSRMVLEADKIIEKERIERENKMRKMMGMPTVEEEEAKKKKQERKERKEAKKKEKARKEKLAAKKKAKEAAKKAKADAKKAKAKEAKGKGKGKAKGKGKGKAKGKSKKAAVSAAGASGVMMARL